MSPLPQQGWHPIIRRPARSKEGPFGARVNVESLLTAKDAENFNPGQNLKTPTSEHLFVTQRPRFSALLPDDVELMRAFDKFEYLVCLSVMHNSRKGDGFTSWPPMGSFVWREAFNPKR